MSINPTNPEIVIPETPNHGAPPALSRLIRSILVVMVGFTFTKGVSLLQTIIIADRFGAGAEYDTFVAGSTMPDYIVRLIGGGALGVAFIPIFNAFLTRNDPEKAWRLGSQVFNSLLIAALTLSLFVIVFAQPLVDYVVASGLSPENAAQAAQLMRILSLGAVIFSVSGVLSGILHGHNHFFLPVLAPIFQDLGLLFGVIFFLEPFGIYGLAYGTLLGAVLHISIQIPGLLMFKARWFPILGWSDPTLRHVFRLMLPRIGIALAFLVTLNTIVNISSRMGEGAISAFGWGLRFMDIPQALIGTAAGIVIFPTLSALNSMGKLEERRAAFSGIIRYIFVATIPATAGMVLVSYDALRILFNEYDSAIIFTSVQILSLAIIIQSLHEILTRAFYAQQDTLRPLIYSVIATLISVISVIGFYQIYRAADDIPLWSPLAVGGPALGYVIAFTVEVVLLAYFLRKSWGDIALPQIGGTVLKTLLATLPMIAAVLILQFGLKTLGFDSYRVSHILIRILPSVLVGGLSFLIAASLLQISEIQALRHSLRAYFRQRLGGSSTQEQ